MASKFQILGFGHRVERIYREEILGTAKGDNNKDNFEACISPNVG